MPTTTIAGHAIEVNEEGFLAHPDDWSEDLGAELRTRAHVAGVSAQDVRAAYEARLIVEPGAARLAATRRPADQLAAMRRAVEEQRANGDGQPSYAFSRPFHLAHGEGYDEVWDQYLQSPDFEPTVRATYGLMVNADELEAMRRKLPDAEAVRGLRLAAEVAKGYRPESLIGENINFWNFKGFRREREMNNLITLPGPYAAQAGVFFRDKHLCRLAARYAMSLVHCDRWEGVFFAFMRGSSWDQRGGLQSVATWECAVILDLCGEWFTPLGRDLILRRFAGEAHGAMCHGTWWWEYMYYGNQVAWLTPGAIYGLLHLEQHMPMRGANYPRPPSRVAPHTDLA